MGLVFLRYADHKFLAETKELEEAGSGRRTIDPADYQAESVLFLPEALRFSSLIQLPEGGNIDAAINDSCWNLTGGNWAMFTVGRIFVGWYAKKIDVRKLIYLSISLALFGVALLLADSSQIITILTSHSGDYTQD